MKKALCALLISILAVSSFAGCGSGTGGSDGGIFRRDGNARDRQRRYLRKGPPGHVDFRYRFPGP